MRTLDSLATAIVALPRLRLHIEGYAYSQRDSRLNQELSEHRAEAVRLYLALRGVPVTQMETHGHGNTLPSNNPVLGSHSELSRHIMLRVDEGAW
jgi:outer membrane protein OmpA-like peptidoglycan-associated protein